MGMYIGNPIDLQIIANANNAFGLNTNPAGHPPNGLPGTRAYFAVTGEAPFDITHTLARVAHRLGIHAKDTQNDQTRGRWYGLLHYIETTVPATRGALDASGGRADDSSRNPGCVQCGPGCSRGGLYDRL
jgi:hypothetical protein